MTEHVALLSGGPPAFLREEGVAPERGSAHRLLENFEMLADAAGGVDRLRRLIVMLGLSGRLTANQRHDRADVVDVPLIRTTMRLDEAADWAGGSGFPKNVQGRADLPLLFCKVSDMNLPGNERFIRRTVHTIDETTARKVRAKVHPPGTVVFPKIGGAIATNKRRILAVPGAIDNNCLGLTPNGHCTSDYLLLFMQSVDLTQYQNDGPVPALNQGRIGAIAVPVPPIAEQKRIVAKVDQLMALCDDLEARQNKKREVGARLTKSALEALTTAEGPEEFDAAWKRVVENFDVLFASAKDVLALRNLVLDLAFRGSLVGSSSGDSSVVLLIGKAEQAWATRKRKEVLPPVGAEERPLSPERWAWHRLGNLAEVVGGVTKGRDLKGRQVRAYPYLRVANVQRGYLDLNEMKDIEIPEEEISKYRLLPGDVLFTEGGDWDKLGRSAVWGAEIDPCIHQNHVFRARLVVPELDSRWFSMFANSPVGRRYFENAAKQTTNLASINMTQLRNCPMPVPPPEEKRRIVAKVERLMKMCDSLEASLRRTEERASKLVEVVVSELVA